MSKKSQCCNSPMRYIDDFLCCANCGKETTPTEHEKFESARLKKGHENRNSTPTEPPKVTNPPIHTHYNEKHRLKNYAIG